MGLRQAIGDPVPRIHGPPEAEWVSGLDYRWPAARRTGPAAAASARPGRGPPPGPAAAADSESPRVGNPRLGIRVPGFKPVFRSGGIQSLIKGPRRTDLLSLTSESARSHEPGAGYQQTELVTGPSESDRDPA